MSTYSAFDGVAVEGSRGAPIGDWLRSSGSGVAAAFAWAAFGVSCLWWPDIGDWSRTHALGIAAFVVASFALFGTLSADFLGTAGPALRRRTPWLVALGLFLTVWELATAKFGWLPLPFFPPPQSILEVYTDDLPKLLDSVFASVKLQLGGYIIGATVGFLTGVSIGWSRSVGYWVHPVLRFIGPLPATAWLPIAFFTFPSSWSASTFLIALATGFPVTVLTWSGVASVSSAYYDVARTLGAKPSLPRAQGRDPGGAAACVRRPVHGARLVVCRAGRSRDDRRQGRARLVPAMGAGLGGLRQHVCGADRDVAAVLRRDHAAVQDARPAAGLAEGSRQMVALAVAEAIAEPAAGAALDIEHVSHAFDIDGAELPVLEDVSLTIKPGEFVALLGPSGCGKSTLLRLVAGLESPRPACCGRTSVRIRGPHPSRVVVFQDPTLFPWRSVWDNVALGLEAQGILKSQRHRVDAALDLVGLSAFRNAYPHQLSGGMAQRVALARALVNDPKILILDEPLGKLDSLTRITMQAELVSLWQRKGFTTLLVTHDAEEALFLANRVIVLSDRPARIKADILVDRPYPRHRGDPYLADLRKQILGLLGLDATW